MKRLFILVPVILLFCVITAKGFVQEETSPPIHNAIASSVSGNQFFISGSLDLFNHSVGEENGQHPLQRLFPTLQKFLNGDPLLNKNAELNRKNEISDYIIYAECHIPRFEGADIIHPFNYFW